MSNEYSPILKNDVFVMKNVLNHNDGVVENNSDFWSLLNVLYQKNAAVPVQNGLFIFDEQFADAMVKEARTR